MLAFSQGENSVLPPHAGDEGAARCHPPKTRRQPDRSHCVFSPPGAMVIVSGWGKQFLQRFPETLMEVKFNIYPSEGDTFAPHWAFLSPSVSQGFGGLDWG